MAVENSPIQNCGLQIFIAEFHAEFTCYVIRNTLHHIETKMLATSDLLCYTQSTPRRGVIL